MSQDVRRRPVTWHGVVKELRDERPLSERHFVYTKSEWCQVAGITLRQYRRFREERAYREIRARMPPVVTTKTAIDGFMRWLEIWRFRWPQSTVRVERYVRWKAGATGNQLAREEGIHRVNMYRDIRAVRAKLELARRMGITREMTERARAGEVLPLKRKAVYVRTKANLPFVVTERGGPADRFEDPEDEDRG